MRYTHVFLDMDGTLLDTGDGVKRSFQYALQKLGRPVLPAAQLDFVLGPPLYWSFHDRLGLPEEEAQRGVPCFASVSVVRRSECLFNARRFCPAHPPVPEIFYRTECSGSDNDRPGTGHRS